MQNTIEALKYCGDQNFPFPDENAVEEAVRKLGESFVSYPSQSQSVKESQVQQNPN